MAVNPARAGMIHWVDTSKAIAEGKPRTRGDDPPRKRRWGRWRP